MADHPKTKLIVVLSVLTWSSATMCRAFVGHSLYLSVRRTLVDSGRLGYKQKESAQPSTANRPKKRRRTWEESYELLKEYINTTGHCNVPQSDKSLGTWVNSQRIEHARYLRRDEDGPSRKTSMTARRKELLDDVGFIWDAMDHTWNTRYDELREFRAANGHCVVPRSSGRLGAWVEKQRIEYKKYRAARRGGRGGVKTTLTDDRAERLHGIGFVWDVREKQFERKIGRLRMFRKMSGHIDPRYMDGSLALWVRKWEQIYRNYLDAAAAGVDKETLSGMFPDNRRIALEEVGFCRGMFDEPRARSAKNRRSSWEERYEELKKYKDKNGHCVVPKNYGPLGSWVRAQRHLMKGQEINGPSFEVGGMLPPERVDRLNKLGFIWDVHQWQWNQTFQELVQYKEEHNSTNVPLSYGNLGLWVSNQRALYNSYRKGDESKSGITPVRVEMLEALGFEFDLGEKIQSAADERWLLRFGELREYKRKWGTFNVRRERDKSLYNWCQYQKACWKNSQLKIEREEKLRSIGFLNRVIYNAISDDIRTNRCRPAAL